MRDEGGGPVKWHAFPVGVALSFDYWSRPRALIGSHQILLAGCAADNDGKGNSGIWRDSKSWPSEAWVYRARVTREEVDDLVAAGLAHWVTRAVADALVAELTPLQEQIDSEERFDWERCRITPDVFEVVRRRSGSIGSEHRVDPGSTQIDKPIDLGDLVAVYYDLGGQVKAQLTSEMNSRNRRIGIEKAKQLGLRGMDGAAIDPRIDTAQRQRPSNTGTGTVPDKPPQTPPGGGVSYAGLDRETAAHLESFWQWLLRSRPAGLNWNLWGGAKVDTVKALLRRSAGNANAVVPQPPVPLRELLDCVRADLEAKFRSPKWVIDTLRTGFRTYVAKDHWATPERPPAPEDPAELERRAGEDRSRREARERELRKVWAEEMPGEPFPTDVAEADRRLRERHGWVN
jgi:hypothetical protein